MAGWQIALQCSLFLTVVLLIMVGVRRRKRSEWRWLAKYERLHLADEMAEGSRHHARSLLHECDEAHLPGDCPLCSEDRVPEEHP